MSSIDYFKPVALMDSRAAHYDATIKELWKSVRVILDFFFGTFAELNVTTIIGFLKYVPMHYSDQITCIAQSSGE